MARPTPAIPRYCKHKATGRAFVKIAGQFRYLGTYGTAASRELYARVVREHEAGGSVVAQPVRPPAPEAVTIAALMAGYWTHAKAYYAYDPAYDGRRPPGEIGAYYDVIKLVMRLYASTPAVEFDPKALRLVQAEMIAMDWCRNVINRATTRLRSIFKWASGEGGMIPTEVHLRLKAVDGLRKGHKGIRNTPKVLKVPDDVLDATLAVCSPRLAAMIRLQLLTGMRSGNLCDMRTADVDITGGNDGGGTWVYRPRKHKTEHHGYELAIRLGPKAQEVLRPYLKPDQPEAFIFSPAEEMAEVRAARAASRKTPLSCGNKPGSNVKRSPKKLAGDHYTNRSYAQAVNRACDRANRWAKGGMIIGDDQRAVPRWHPHQLRHNRGTLVRASYGVEGVLAALGQKTAAMADRYAEIEAEKAERVAAELG